MKSIFSVAYEHEISDVDDFVEVISCHRSRTDDDRLSVKHTVQSPYLERGGHWRVGKIVVSSVLLSLALFQ
jgi:hypothetical protein